MARRRSVVRRAGAGRRFTPGVLLAIALAIAAIAFIGMQAARPPGANDVVIQTGDDAAAAAGRAATGPAHAGDSFLRRLGAMWNTTARVRELEQQNRELATWRDIAERLAERNARYEALLRMPTDQFGEGADVAHAIAAQLVLDSGGPFTRTLVANAGADHGVRVGFIVLNENGLVGRVVSVGRRSARVLMLDDYNSRIPVMGEASRVRAVLAGQATRAPELLTAPYQVQAPRLDFIVGAQNLREGEHVITTGDGGLFPRGIPVGVAHRGGDGQWRVALSAAQRPIDFVRLIPYAGVTLPENEPAADQSPPLASSSAVSAIGRELTPPPPVVPNAQPPVRPARREASPDAAATPVPTPPAPAEAPPPAPESPAPEAPQ